jgi:hypothetical protein
LHQITDLGVVVWGNDVVVVLSDFCDVESFGEPEVCNDDVTIVVEK